MHVDKGMVRGLRLLYSCPCQGPRSSLAGEDHRCKRGLCSQRFACAEDHVCAPCSMLCLYAQKEMLSRMHITWDEIVLGRVVGRGGFGTVYKGVWQVGVTGSSTKLYRMPRGCSTHNSSTDSSRRCLTYPSRNSLQASLASGLLAHDRRVTALQSRCWTLST